VGRKSVRLSDYGGGRARRLAEAFSDGGADEIEKEDEVGGAADEEVGLVGVEEDVGVVGEEEDAGGGGHGPSPTAEECEAEGGIEQKEGEQHEEGGAAEVEGALLESLEEEGSGDEQQVSGDSEEAGENAAAGATRSGGGRPGAGRPGFGRPGFGGCGGGREFGHR
jgi:hypothetical protein